jgi:flagellar motor switch protein FliM
MADIAQDNVNEPVAEAAEATTQPEEAPTACGKFQSVEEWEFRQSSGFSEHETSTITAFHQPLARDLARTMSLRLGVSFEVELGETRETTAKQYVTDLPADAFLTALTFQGESSSVVFQMDSALVAPVLDLLLGGTAERISPRAELSDIDAQILSDISHILGRQLEIAWRELDLHVCPEMVIGKAVRRQLAGGLARYLVLTLTVKMGESTGTMNLLLPPTIIDAILRTVDARPPEPDAGSRRTIGEHCRASLLQVPIPMELILHSMSVSVRELTRLAPNTTLRLPLRADQPATLRVAGKNCFQASAVKTGDIRAAQLDNPISETLPDSEAKDSL